MARHGVDMDQVHDTFIAKQLFSGKRYLFSTWQLMRGRAFAIVRPQDMKLRYGLAMDRKEYKCSFVSNLIVIDDSYTLH